MSDTDLHPELDDIIKRNPKVDAEQLRAAQEQLKKLSEQGFTRPGYSILPSHERLPLTRESGQLNRT